MKYGRPLLGPCSVDKVPEILEAVPHISKKSKRGYREDIPSPRYGMEGGMRWPFGFYSAVSGGRQSSPKMINPVGPGRQRLMFTPPDMVR
jgi:hypothetical protein